MRVKIMEFIKKHRALTVIGCILLAIVLFLVVVNAIPPKKNVQNNPFVVEKGELPMIAAHRGGSNNNPENTLLAFREAVVTIGVDIIESDLYMTRDGYLVYNHDSYIDETCNVNGDLTLDEVEELCEDKNNRHYIKDMTLAELRQYNFGYYFEDKNGERIYKDVENIEAAGLQIATVDQLFEMFYESHPDLMFIVEIKNDGDLGREACRILAGALDSYPEYKDQVVIGTFNDEIEQELKDKYPDLLRGAPTGTAAKFVLTQYLGVNIFDDGDFACLQIPMSYELKGIEIPLVSQSVIDRAHRRNIAVQYWTINDADDMRKLIEMGVDCIMTDDPVLLSQILDEYRAK
jgi:glycerophosphoryl diester phosphodiesterase